MSLQAAPAMACQSPAEDSTSAPSQPATEHSPYLDALYESFCPPSSMNPLCASFSPSLARYPADQELTVIPAANMGYHETEELCSSDWFGMTDLSYIQPPYSQAEALSTPGNALSLPSVSPLPSCWSPVFSTFSYSTDGGLSDLSDGSMGQDHAMLLTQLVHDPTAGSAQQQQYYYMVSSVDAPTTLEVYDPADSEPWSLSTLNTRCQGFSSSVNTSTMFIQAAPTPDCNVFRAQESQQSALTNIPDNTTVFPSLSGARSQNKIETESTESAHKVPKKRTRGPVSCTVCDKVFSRPCDLRDHMYIHEDQFECPICGKSFREAGGLTLHKRTHAGPITCGCCFRTFKKQANLSKHMKYHNPNREKRRCHIEGCGKEYARGGCLNRHIKTVRS